MEKNYEPNKIEPKWQEFWEKQGLYRAQDFSDKPKTYLLVEFPYPSGAGLHVGHCRSYTALDVIARKKRMEGENVLFPMGWDAFGLPTENYAIKTGIHPAIATKQNTETFKRQEMALGLSFDWNREINTTDPAYYKWTQWIFLKLFENGLAYKARIPINWCLACQIGLANEEVVDGKCERCGSEVEKREKEQWLIKITEYAERLIADLELVDFPERVKTQQVNWIGRSEGALVKFPLVSSHNFIEVFTTRIDTIFSGTFLIVAPGSKLIDEYQDQIKNWDEVLKYREAAQKISDIDRANEEKDITGIELKGITAVNPATNEKMPVWIADFVLEQYGTGAVFADGHDKRDFKMGKKYGLPLKTSLVPDDESITDKVKNLEICYEGEGVLFNSGQFNGLTSAESRPKIISWLQENGFAESKINYKLRDWVFSRQHYWGEPTPLVHCQKCGWVGIPEKDLPVELPNVENYKPTETGESPLASIEDWVNTKCPKCKGPAKRETDVMPNWAGSNWYFMRYCDPNNAERFAGPELLKYWMPVDWYNGGMEHTTLHLLYSRFIYKFLWDIGEVPKELGPEPYKKRTSHGMILGEGGIKMSKSKGNVINPDEVIKEWGADTLRVYEMFMGPFDQAIAWDTKGVRGVRRFLDRVYNLTNRKLIDKQSVVNDNLERLLHKTIKKVGEDIENMKFNTAVAALMILVNKMEEKEEIPKEILKKFLLILGPFAPHMAEEIWHILGEKQSIFLSGWPKYDPQFIEDQLVNLVVQINGRVRDSVEIARDVSEGEAQALVLQSAKLKQWIEGKEIKKVVFVPNKLINFVI
ncbi:MAG: leucine--tRNA ligase [Candidatus Pacebacteria bacterium]|nr:leucine--tRNA ligase [Candidatus Paceibacterota bacterium]